MPLPGKSKVAGLDEPYFKSLKALDIWASTPSRKLAGILPYIPRSPLIDSGARGKLLVCHDYKGGYVENPASLSYTFNFWSSCDSFVYFSHHRITVPPPGWITAAHRQGVKMLGTLIFEGHDGGEEDCLRLLVGNLPGSINGPAKSTTPSSSLPLSPHYARLLADLALQRGFDGYLLNVECPLRGGLEQTRGLAAWITLLTREIQTKVGSHAEVVWYDSVIVTGQLAWQDRLNSLNLPFFLPSSSIFTNYTWGPDYPNLTTQYFLSLEPDLTGNTPAVQPHFSKKSLNDIYMGVDIWGRGSHGGGGFGSYKAISHVAPDSLGLSVALFGQAWTWESEQDKPGWNWQAWWEYESKLWVGPAKGKSVTVPEAPRRLGEPECPHGPFLPISAFFPRYSPPDPIVLPLHTTFSPGVGLAWFVNGAKAYQSDSGWTDLDKTCTVGDLVWPQPALSWEGEAREDDVPDATSAIFMEDAWNGGSSLKISISSSGSTAKDATRRCLWLPIQSVNLTRGRSYEATAIYKVDTGSSPVNLDVGLLVKSIDEAAAAPIKANVVGGNDSDLANGWSKICIRFTASGDGETSYTGAIGFVTTIVMEDASLPLSVSILVGQLNIYPTAPEAAAPHTPLILWADFTSKRFPLSTALSGTLTWETAASFAPINSIAVTSPEDPVAAWKTQPSSEWFPTFLHFNLYVLPYSADGRVGQPEDATWIGTTGWDGRKNSFFVEEDLSAHTKNTKVRFYVQGVTDRGVVLDWDKCVYVDYNPSGR